MKIKLYQINMGRDTNRVAFLSSETLIRFFGCFRPDNTIYDCVYEGEIEADDLEAVYRKFNIDAPDNYIGRSMSVSDIVEIIAGDNTGCYFCDTSGFKKIDFATTEIPVRTKKDKIKVVLVEPGKTAKTAEIGTQLADLQKVVGGDIETFYPFEDDVCIVRNEEGKFNGMAPNRAVYGENKEILDIIFGTFFICDCSGEAFGSLSEEMIEKYIKLFKNPERFEV